MLVPEGEGDARLVSGALLFPQHWSLRAKMGLEIGCALTSCAPATPHAGVPALACEVLLARPSLVLGASMLGRRCGGAARTLGFSQCCVL